ncbi:MAG: hypothetical protein LBD76_03485 [Prevotellaceae bacterium]|jgi:hypothetical protein|nr:hypothetical protein [Prevotellaceae bacterium]
MFLLFDINIFYNKNPHGLLFVETLEIQGGASGLIISNVHRSKNDSPRKATRPVLNTPS